MSQPPPPSLLRRAGTSAALLLPLLFSATLLPLLGFPFSGLSEEKEVIQLLGQSLPDFTGSLASVTQGVSPLALLSLALDDLRGNGASSYRLTGIILHCINGLLLTLIAKKLLGKREAALLCGALFIVHPLSLEAVVHLPARGELLGTFFCLSAVLASLKTKKPDSLLAIAGRGILSLLATLCSPAFIVLPLISDILRRLSFPRRAKGVDGKLRYQSLVLSATLLIVVGGSSLIPHPESMGAEIAFTSYPGQQLSKLALTTEGLFFPTSLMPVYFESGSDPHLGLMSFTVLTIAWLAHWIWKSANKFERGLILAAALSLAPYLVWPTRPWHADRHSYLPLALIVLAVVGTLDRTLRIRSGLRRFVAACLLLTSLTLLSIQVFQWRSPESIWEAETWRYPDVQEPLMHLALSLQESGNFPSAQFTLLQFDDKFPDSSLNRRERAAANAWGARTDRAATLLMLDVKEGRPGALVNLGKLATRYPRMRRAIPLHMQRRAMEALQ